MGVMGQMGRMSSMRGLGRWGRWGVGVIVSGGVCRLGLLGLALGKAMAMSSGGHTAGRGRGGNGRGRLFRRKLVSLLGYGGLFVFRRGAFCLNELGLRLLRLLAPPHQRTTEKQQSDSSGPTVRGEG